MIVRALGKSHVIAAGYHRYGWDRLSQMVVKLLSMLTRFALALLLGTAFAASFALAGERCEVVFAVQKPSLSQLEFRAGGRTGKRVRFLARVFLSEHESLDIYGHPRLINNKYFVLAARGVAAGDHAAGAGESPVSSSAEPAWVSLESLYRVYGETFFQSEISLEKTYLAPVRSFSRHEFELSTLVKDEGKNVLLRDRHGGLRRLSKFDFFVSNLVPTHLLSESSLSLGGMREYFARGGKGRIFLYETSTNRETELDAYFITVESLPSYSQRLFLDAEVYGELQKTVKGGVALLYGASDEVRGLHVPAGNDILVNMSNRLSTNPRVSAIYVSRETTLATIVHEKRHLSDESDPRLLGLFEELNRWNTQYHASEHLDLQALWIFVLEQRAYAAAADAYGEKLKLRHEIFIEDYLGPALAQLRRLKEIDPALQERIVSRVRENLLPNVYFALPESI